MAPNEAARQGILPDPGNPGGTIVVPVDPAVRPYLDEYPLPNGEELGGGLAAYSFPFSHTLEYASAFKHNLFHINSPIFH